ncbi:MAG: A24 family peptidase [Planctomycetota bacterium]
MDILSTILAALVEHWPVWVVTVFLILAAVIDGIKLKVPNWLTFSMIISGWMYSASVALWTGGSLWGGLGWSFLGMIVGLLLLLPAYAIGGMGAGDVKLMAGLGAWMHATHTFYAFCVTAVVGAILAIAMIVTRRAWQKHLRQLWVIATEILIVRDPNALSELAANRKSSMLLLPYGIPIAIGSISYFAWMGLLI